MSARAVLGSAPPATRVSGSIGSPHRLLRCPPTVSVRGARVSITAAGRVRMVAHDPFIRMSRSRQRGCASRPATATAVTAAASVLPGSLPGRSTPAPQSARTQVPCSTESCGPPSVLDGRCCSARGCRPTGRCTSRFRCCAPTTWSPTASTPLAEGLVQDGRVRSCRLQGDRGRDAGPGSARRATLRPAEVLGLDREIGPPCPGTCANLAVLEQGEGRDAVPLRDVHGVERPGVRWVPWLTVCGGEVVAGAAPERV